MASGSPGGHHSRPSQVPWFRPISLRRGPSPCGDPPLSGHLPEFRLLGWPGLSVRPCLRELEHICAGPGGEASSTRLSPWGPCLSPFPESFLQGPSFSPSPRLDTVGPLQPQRPAGCQGLGLILWRPGCWESRGFPGARPPRTDRSQLHLPAAPASKELREDLLISPRRNRCSCQGGDRCPRGPAWPYPARGPVLAGRVRGLMMGGEAQRSGRCRPRPHPPDPGRARTFARGLLAPPCGLSRKSACRLPGRPWSPW